ncbi:GerMN domain-containing protein [Metabacillus idriensis]|uniref:GerMN domain-containing protein n=1 Tax=Metabacillus idriensis TaxID=324768 RepID=UPI00174CCF86|nr:GerMN domain-containing protein [Metabacillus idriensis]
MNKSNWNEDQIAEALKKLPLIEDKRTTAEIYARLPKKEYKHRKPWVTPAFASIAALFILLLISPFFINQLGINQSSSKSESSMDKASLDQAQPFSENAESKKEAELTGGSEKSTFVARSEDGFSIVTAAYPDQQVQNMITLSFQMEKSEDYLTMFQSVLSDFNPAQAGLSSSSLSGLKLAYAEGTPSKLLIDVNENPFALSASETDNKLFTEGIEESFRWQDIEEAEYFKNGEKGIELGTYGFLEGMKLGTLKRKAYFLYQESIEAPKLLAPSLLPFDKLSEALSAMKGNGTLGLKPVIEKTVVIKDIEETNDDVTIEFTSESTIDDNETDTLMLEAILMTAKEFGYESVKFEGLNVDRVGEMDLTEAVPVPFSPNPVDLNE